MKGAKYFAVSGTQYWHPKSEVVAKCKVPVLSTGTQNPRPDAKYLGSVLGLPYVRVPGIFSILLLIHTNAPVTNLVFTVQYLAK